MPKKLISLSSLSHEEWLQWRRKGIGGSDAATVVGLNPYSSLYELWADKQGFLPSKEDTEAMRTGRDLEQYVADRFCEATGKKVQKLPYMYCHDEYPFITANVDRKVVGENAGLECKTTSPYNKTDFAEGNVQLNYLCQCWHYMNVMGYDRMYLAVLVMGKGFYWYTIEQDKEQQQALLNAEVDFWNTYILDDCIPEPDGSESADNVLKTIYGKETRETVNLMHCDRLLEDYAKARDNCKAAESEKERLAQQIKLHIGDAATGIGSKFKADWISQTRKSVDTKKLAAEYPQVYEQVIKTTQSRTFRFAERKDVQ